MPTFERIPLSQARARSAMGKRAAQLQEYMAYIQQLSADEAGVLQPSADETTQAIRRRLTAATQALGTTLEVRRTGEAVYFWVATRGPGASRRSSRRPKSGDP